MSVKIKSIVIGDGAVGKSCLLIRYITDTFGNIRGIFPNYERNLTVDGQSYKYTLWDTGKNFIYFFLIIVV